MAKLPFEPAPIEELRRRLPAAMVTVHNARAIKAGLAPAPSGLRENVFDAVDDAGVPWRLACSLDSPSPGEPTLLHVSVSTPDANPSPAGAMALWAELLGRPPAGFREAAETGGAAHLLFDPLPDGWELAPEDLDGADAYVAAFAAARTDKVEVVEIKDGFKLLPPADGHCRICAVAHEPDVPHNADSLFFQMRFEMRYGRAGTWADAIAHCPAPVRRYWRDALEQAKGWTEPPAGVEPVAEPIDG